MCINGKHKTFTSNRVRVTGIFLPFCKKLENWNKSIKQILSDNGQQRVLVCDPWEKGDGGMNLTATCLFVCCLQTLAKQSWESCWVEDTEIRVWGGWTCWNLDRGLELRRARAPEIYMGDPSKMLKNTKLLVRILSCLYVEYNSLRPDRARQVRCKWKNSELTQSSEILEF